MFLPNIIATKQSEVEQLHAQHTVAGFIEQIQRHPIPRRPFREALSCAGLQLIAEIKKASPSKGVIRADFDPVLLAQTFEKSGAACLSVLTDEVYFQGHLSYLMRVRDHVSIPLLRKDFIIDPLQIYESKYAGADAILLIKAVLSNEQLSDFLQIANALDLECLIEIHSQEELEDVLSIPAASMIRMIGINHRDLRTFELNMSLSDELAPYIQRHRPDVAIVAESGYSTPSSLRHAIRAGCQAVLIGEGLAQNADLLAAFKKGTGFCES